MTMQEHWKLLIVYNFIMNSKNGNLHECADCRLILQTYVFNGNAERG